MSSPGSSSNYSRLTGGSHDALACFDRLSRIVVATPSGDYQLSSRYEPPKPRPRVSTTQRIAWPFYLIRSCLLEKMLEANPLCAECTATEVEWVSTSIGVTLCADCAIAHRKLGTNISRLRSIYMDLWSPRLVECIVESMGNSQVSDKGFEHVRS